MSTTLKGLQSLINRCYLYGLNNYIKFNAAKTEFLLSGKKYLQIYKIDVADTTVHLHEKLKHLGFFWDNKKSHTATLNNVNFDHRITEFKATIHTLIRSGIRFCHPSTIIQLYSSLIVPKLTYGLELCYLSDSNLKYIDTLGRIALKTLFNVSKYSKNYIPSLFIVDAISIIVLRNKLNFFLRLLDNKITRKLILTQLQEKAIQNSFVYEIYNICHLLNIDFYRLLFQDQRIKFYSLQDSIPDEKI